MKNTFFFNTKGSIVEHSTDAPVFAVKGFRRGYYPIYTHATAESLNKDTPPDVLESALIASVAGWNCPGAAAAREHCEQAERAQIAA